MAKLLWLDLETTGLRPESDVILEVAAVLTDGRLDEISRYHAVVRQLEPALSSMAPWAKQVHTENGLLDEVRKSGKSDVQVEEELLSFLERHVQAADRIILSGSSIHFDRSFIKSKWPRLDQRLHYRMIDVTSFKEALRIFHDYEREHLPAKHRAERDILGSMSEFRDYMRLVRIPS